MQVKINYFTIMLYICQLHFSLFIAAIGTFRDGETYAYQLLFYHLSHFYDIIFTVFQWCNLL